MLRASALRRSFGLTALSLLSVAPLSARQECVFPIHSGPRIEHQLDGRAITLFLRGTPWMHWYEDAEGYAVARVEERWVYARVTADGSLSPTDALVGEADPAALGLTARVQPSRALSVGAATSPRKNAAAPGVQTGGAAFLSGSGGVDNLVLLLRFSNHGPSGQNRTLPSAADVNVIMNAVGGHPTLAPTGSVRDHYLETSYGQFTIDSTAAGWLNLPNTEAYYANGNSGLTTRTWEAITSGLNLADATIDFTQFDADGDLWIDAVTFLHSGYGAEWGGTDQYGTNYVDRMWSHKWSIPVWTSAEGVRVADYNISPGLWSTSGSQPGRIGVVCHELGHFFGLPDLYDTGGVGSSSQGIGNWCLMAAGSWGFDSSQQRPSHMSAWSKIKLGWVMPQLLLPGNATAPQVEFTPTIFRIDSGYPPGEYLLIENRQQVGFDQVIPQGGLAIWHVDDSKGSISANNPNADEGYPGQSGWPTNGRHYRTALLQADGGYDMEKNLDRGDSGDVYRQGGVSAINSSTTPNTSAYQGGTIVNNGNSIASIGASSANMPFTFASPSSPTITTSSAPPAVLGQPYSLALASSGGTAPKTWFEYRASPSYSLSNLGSGSFALGGTAQGWQADEGVWSLTLPFNFPYYERSYSKVYVSSNGFVDLAPVGDEWDNTDGSLRAALRIAVLWDDLATDGASEDVFVDTATSGQVRIRWKGHEYNSGAACNFAVVLYADGRIRFEYGSGNTNLTPSVGVSRGEGGQLVVAPTHDGQTTLTNASTLQFMLGGSLMPPGLTLSAGGVLSGTPTSQGSWQPIFRVTDASYRYDQDPLALSVIIDCNGNGIADSQDIVNGAPDCNSNAVPDECEPDTDGDGVINACDGCPNDPSKIAPGICGCGVADTDSDGDGTPNCNDGCPSDPGKIAPGICGCGIADTDSDGDGTPNCNDGCPSDPGKIAPGICGCGVADTDSDGDGTPNCNDGCPNDPSKIAPGICGCGVADTDSDGDGTPNCNDGCPNDPSKIAPGVCGCGVADTDSDGDGTPNCNDGCPDDPAKINPGQCGCGSVDLDTDLDGVADCVDNCIALANPGQADCDLDNVGDVCELDSGTQWDVDNNGTPDQCEACPHVVNYCTAGTTTNGCNAAMSATGLPSASATSGFVLTCSGVEGQKAGLLFYGINGPKASLWAPGSSSYLCVKSPTQRIPSANSGGTANACDGSFSVDFASYLSSHPSALGQPATAGTIFNAQAWFRDPPAPGTTNLSNGVQWILCP